MCRVIVWRAYVAEGIGRRGGGVRGGGGCRLQQRRRLVDKAEKFVGADSAGPPESTVDWCASVCTLRFVCVSDCFFVHSIESGRPSRYCVRLLERHVLCVRQCVRYPPPVIRLRRRRRRRLSLFNNIVVVAHTPRRVSRYKQKLSVF